MQVYDSVDPQTPAFLLYFFHDFGLNSRRTFLSEIQQVILMPVCLSQFIRYVLMYLVLQGDCGSSHSMAQKILTWLCPAVHTILSDGLLPSVQGFFGPLPNSPWKVAGASIKQGE